jgi:hypothetical protein
MADFLRKTFAGENLPQSYKCDRKSVAQSGAGIRAGQDKTRNYYSGK